MTSLQAGDWVRVFMGGSCRHRSRAKVIRIDGDKAVIHPVGHKKLEVVDLDRCKSWKSRNEQIRTEKEKPC